ncbi:HAD-IC family P-type ATPase [Paralimibaculum aggregatum]|uniref:HAD-IC family P-type ATPase n=1 Tax=Paralimibaculum aggregatum TaxID=3036245 RepID=A0ABQ6LLR6_9RHOB|nr:HAD-IC family P-type ATPase [Limibaculum sp. NKW23]GMG83922.1 HAD-IC family P-type ATPase [Limibaculum sp. NKW23]
MTGFASAVADRPTAPAPEREDGLTPAEAASRLARHGRNRLPEPAPPGPLALFVRQFLNPFIYILGIAAVAALAVGQLPSAVFIVAVLLLNALIGAVQENSAHRSASALRQMIRGHATVVRGGMPIRIDSEEVVPGDLVLLASGDRVPADLRLLDAQGLAVDESMLTGESLAVTKAAATRSAEEAPLSERHDVCFAGSTVTHGRGRGEVLATGLETQIGGIARSLGSARLSEPPLMIRIRQFTWQVAAAIGIAIAALAGLMGLVGGYLPQEMAMMAIGLAVSTIPEGLPAALTVALAIGMRRMSASNVVIRKLVAVEALGSCTFICSDKTGTLTVNELTIARAVLPGGTAFDVTGAGVRPGGAVLGERTERLRALAIAGALANESHLDYSGGDWVSEGDIVDVAFLVFAKKLGLSLSALRAEQRRLALIPYESERAFSASLDRRADGAVLHAKGSPEKMLALCTAMETAAGTVPIDRAAIARQFEALAGEGYRIIALARREGLGAAEHLAEEALGGMTFLGMVAMIDPLRPEARAAVAQARRGGIGVAMVTGDHPATARAIAADLELIDGDGPVVTGPMIRAAEPGGEAALDALIQPARVFARIEPRQKVTIVESFLRAGHFVAVTGDGVNDAPAMRRANVGVAMGRGGTDVARDAADLILTDDNFASIIAGIEQGRVVYNNIRKVVALLIATGFSALLLFFLTVLAGLPMPLTAVQLLWLNLVANGLQDVALAFEPREGGELDRRPRRPDEPIFEARVLRHVLLAGTVMGLLAFGLYAALIWSGHAPEAARNLTLMLMVLFGNLHALSSRSETRSVFAMPLARNPFLALAVPAAQLLHVGAMYVPGLSGVLEIAPISLAEWAGLLCLAAVLLGVEEAAKALERRRAGPVSRPGPAARG